MSNLLGQVSIRSTDLWRWTLDMLLVATVMLVVAATATHLARRASAAMRHRIWSLTFLALLVAPLLASVLPAWHLPITFGSVAERPIAAAATNAAVSQPIESNHVESQRSRAPEPSFSRPAPSEAAPPATSPHTIDTADLPQGVSSSRLPRHSDMSGTPRWSIVATWLGNIWLIGIALFFAPYAYGLFWCHTIRRSSQAFNDKRWKMELRRCARVIGLHRDVELLLAVETMMPITFGLIWPSIVLPADATSWPSQRIRRVLLHELSHVQRRDVLCQAMARVACAFYWFHPLAWLGLAQMRRDRELACDDRVLESGERPSSYAADLLLLVRTYRVSPISSGVAMARRSQLNWRVTAILAQRRRGALSARAHRISLSIAAVLALSLSALSISADAPSAGASQPNRSGPPTTTNAVDHDVPDPLPASAFRRYGTSRFRHGKRIGSVGVSTSGDLAVASSGSLYVGSTRVYDLKTGRVLHVWGDSPHSSEAAGISPNGKLIAIKGDTRLHLLDASSHEEIAVIDLPRTRTITSWITFSPDNKRLAVSGEGKTVQVIDLDSHKIIRSLHHDKAVYATCFTPDGTQLVAGGNIENKNQRVAVLWDIATGTRLREFVSVAGGFRALAISPDGRTLAGSGEVAIVRIWDFETAEVLHTFEPDGRQIRSVAYSPDGKTIAAAGDTIRLYDPISGKERLTIDVPNAIGLTFSSDGRILTAAVEGAICRWDTAQGQPLTPTNAPLSAVDQIASTPNGRLLLSHDESGKATIWDRETGKRAHEIPMAWQRAMAVSPNDRLVAAVEDPRIRYTPQRNKWTHEGAKIQVYDLEKQQFVDRFDGFKGEGHFISFTPDGREVITLDYEFATARIWDFTTGKLKRSLSMLRENEKKLLRGFNPIGHATLSPDGKKLAIGYHRLDNTTGRWVAGPVRIWDLSAEKELVELQGHPNSINDMDYSPDGRFLAVCAGMPGNGELMLWDTTTEKRVLHGLPGDRYADHVVFSPDGHAMVTSEMDGTISVWNTGSWKRIAHVQGHRDQVSALHFTHDGQLLSGSMDTTIIAWELPSLGR